jgi:hypothetical protein
MISPVHLAAAAASDSSDTTPVRLRCLAGGAVPQDIVESATRAARLSASATRELSPVLRPSVMASMTPELAQRLNRYCAAHEIAEADLGHVLRVARWLIREASAIDLSPEDVTGDATTLFGDHPELIALLGREYEALRPVLRKDLITDALLRHGNVLDDIDWRIDVVTADRRAPRVGLPVAMVTLSYRSAEKAERLTLQLLPEQLQRLEAVFGALAQKAGRAG